MFFIVTGVDLFAPDGVEGPQLNEAIGVGLLLIFEADSNQKWVLVFVRTEPVYFNFPIMSAWPELRIALHMIKRYIKDEEYQYFE